MKKRTLFSVLAVLLVLLIVVILLNPTVRLYISMVPYLIALKEYPPEELQLTIYYMECCVATRAPVSVEELKEAYYDGIVTVLSDQLALNWESLRGLNPSVLQPEKEKEYMNARLYYVIEKDGMGQVLEVVLDDIGENVYVNGIEVDYDPILVDIIDPFLDTKEWSHNLHIGVEQYDSPVLPNE